MKCIIVDDEPIAREGIEDFIHQTAELELSGSFGSAESAAEYIKKNPVDLVFLDIQMPEINGIEFAQSISPHTLIIFITAYSEYALHSYEVDAIDYLVKPIELERFQKAVNKAVAYHSLLINAQNEKIEDSNNQYIFVKSERRFFKINYDEILFIEGLKDYVIIQTEKKRVITRMYLRTIYELLPPGQFFRVSKSYIINMDKIDSFDNNDVLIGDHEIGIGNTYRDDFFSVLMVHKT